MKNLIMTIVAIAVLMGLLGLWRGWFEVETNKHENRIRTDVNLHPGKFEQDKERLLKLLGEHSKTTKDKLAALKEKSKKLAGEAREKAQEEINRLSKNQDKIEARINEVKESTEDKFDEIKKSVTKEFGKEKSGDKKEDDERPR